MPALCRAPRSAQVYKAALRIPPEIQFLLGNKGTLAHESVQIEGALFGAHIPTSVAATSGAITLASGFSEGGIGIRLVIDEKYFCTNYPKILVIYSMTDALGTQLPALRVRLLPSETEEELTLTAAGFSTIIGKVDEKYGKDFKFFIDDSFLWLEAYLGPKGMWDPAREYCHVCSNNGRKRFRMATGLARFLDSVDPRTIVAHNEPRPLSTWAGTIRFQGSYRFDQNGVLHDDDDSLLSVDLSFSENDVLSFVDARWFGEGLQIRNISQHGTPIEICDEDDAFC